MTLYIAIRKSSEYDRRLLNDFLDILYVLDLSEHEYLIFKDELHGIIEGTC